MVVGEYSQILIPQYEEGSGAKGQGSSQGAAADNWALKVKLLGLVITVFLLGMVGLASFCFLSNQSKVGEVEAKLSELELDLETFFQVLKEELDYERKSGDVEKVQQRRSKRQVPFPQLPVSFGPEVGRTEDGVPVLQTPYGEKIGKSQKGPAPTPESTGLRLYEGLVETGGRNEPKSLDFFGNVNYDSEEFYEPDGLLPHHKVSAAWSEKHPQPQIPPASRLQVRSGDSGYDERYGGPKFANELSYTRSSSSSNSNSGHVSNNYHRARKPRPGPGATYHRNSRVAATGGEGQGHGHGQTQGQGRRRPSQQRAPLRKLQLGNGQGEVLARVIQDNDDSYVTGRRHYASGSRKAGGLRRESPVYLSRPPVETRKRPPVLPTEHPAGYTEGRGPLNVTISRSVPFGKYYQSAWESSRPNSRVYYSNSY